jgi:hypothetical protein
VERREDSAQEREERSFKMQSDVHVSILRNITVEELALCLLRKHKSNED